MIELYCMCAFIEFLIIFSIILTMIEIIISSGGVLAFSGIIVFLTAMILIFIWHVPVPTIFLNVTIPTFVVLFILSIVIIILAWKAHKKKPIIGEKTLIGKKAKCIKTIDKDSPGIVEIYGEMWTAVSDERIEKGETVVIINQESLKLKVKKGV